MKARVASSLLSRFLLGLAALLAGWSVWLGVRSSSFSAHDLEAEWRMLRFQMAALGLLGAVLMAAFIWYARQRRRAEEALRASEARAHQIVTSAQDGIITTDESGTIASFNPAAGKMFGCTAEEAAGRNLNELLPLFRWDRAGQGSGSVRTLEGRRKDGSTFPVELVISEGTIAGRRLVSGILRDITERVRLEEQLLHAQKMDAVGRLAGGVAHDFNNLLTAISGYSEMLICALGEQDPLRADVEQIRRAGERAATLTRQLLAFSRKQILQPRVLDLNSVVRDMEKMLRRVIGEHIELKTELDGGLGRVKADPGQLEQVIINLVVNARDAMAGGGKLTVETANVVLNETYASRHADVNLGAYAMLAVTDTGAGMDRETQTHLFEPFYTTKGPGKGTGLGLSTVYGIVAQSGGRVWVYSEPGHGTTFKVYLPLVDEAPAASRLPAASAEAPRGTETVLLVEDEDEVRGLVDRVLTGRGYTVLTARDGEEAVEKAAGHPGQLDLLLTDIVMPKLGGPELAGRLAVTRPAMRVLFMSGYPDETVVHQAVLAPGAAFIQKPFSPLALAARVREVLDLDGRRTP